MQNRQTILFLFVLCLLINLGCRRKQPELIEPPDPPCDNGSCCYLGESFKAYKKLNGEAAHFDGRDVLLFEFPLYEQKKIPLRGFLICPVTISKLPKIPVDDRFPEEIKEYKYKIWGRVMQAVNIYDFTGNPVFFIAVDRIETRK